MNYSVIIMGLFEFFNRDNNRSIINVNFIRDFRLVITSAAVIYFLLITF